MSGGKLRHPGHERQSVLHLLRKADIFLIAVCLLAALFLGIFFTMHRVTGNVVSISRDGAELYRIDLNEIDTGRQPHYYLVLLYTNGETHIMHFEDYPELPEDMSYNLFSVRDDTVTMEAADCADQICVHHRPITSAGENIICLPHRLVVELAGGSGKIDSERDENMDELSRELLDGVAR